jgi:hypothetical protein
MRVRPPPLAPSALRGLSQIKGGEIKDAQDGVFFIFSRLIRSP